MGGSPPDAVDSFGQPRVGLVDHAAFGFLSSSIDFFEFTGEFFGARDIASQQELEGSVGAAHSTGCVEPWADAERDVGRLHRRRDSGAGEQAPQPRRARRLQGFESERRDDPVLAAQRYEVSDRPECGDAPQALVSDRSAQPNRHRLGQLEGEPDTREVGERIVASRLPGIDQKDALGSRSPGRWWSVTMTSTPAARAASIAA